MNRVINDLCVLDVTESGFVVMELAEGGTREEVNQRTSAAPQVRPPPIAAKSTNCPGFRRPSAAASESASGTEAAEVAGPVGEVEAREAPAVGGQAIPKAHGRERPGRGGRTPGG